MRNSFRAPFFTENRPAESGSVGLPLLLLSGVLAGAAFAVLGYSLIWRSRAQSQLRLDRCVEKVASDLVSVQTGIEGVNQRMRAERAAALAAAAPTFGESLSAVKPILAAEVAIAEALRIRWALRQATWLVRRGCDSRDDRFLPLPGLRWSRPIPDSLGPRPLEWSGARVLDIHLWRGNRFSQARIEGKDGIGGDRKWRPRWIPRLASE